MFYKEENEKKILKTWDKTIRIYKDFDPMMHNTKMNGKSASFNNSGAVPGPRMGSPFPLGWARSSKYAPNF